MPYYTDFYHKLMDNGYAVSMNGNVRVAFVSNAYTPNRDTHTTWADVEANELNVTNYAAPDGLVPGTQGLTKNGTTKQTEWDGADVSVSAMGAATIEYLVWILDNGGAASTWNLLAYEQVTKVVADGTDVTVSVVDTLVLGDDQSP